MIEKLPEGYIPLQRENGELVYAACMNPESQFFGWLMWRHPDGQWVSKRELKDWEIMQVEDQAHYGIVQESHPTTAATKPALVHLPKDPDRPIALHPGDRLTVEVQKPLTDEEVVRIVRNLGWGDNDFDVLEVKEVARAIERAHGIGGSE